MKVYELINEMRYLKALEEVRFLIDDDKRIENNIMPITLDFVKLDHEGYAVFYFRQLLKAEE